MRRHIHRIVEARVRAHGVLALRFADGTERVVDLRRVLRGRLYGPLADPVEFARVQVDDECGTVTWPCGADFDPGVLYDWAESGPRMAALAESWG